MSEPAHNVFRIKSQSRFISEAHDILEEKMFLKMLCLERKRAERSARRFVLMLLESGSLLNGGTEARALQKILQALSDSTRETDIKGWYEDGAVIGVIFTEIGTAEGRAVAKALLSRITHALGSILRIEDINKVRLSFHVFPEDAGRQSTTGCGSADSPLYPDLAPYINKRSAAFVMKRAMDILGSSVALTLFSPIYLAVAAAIKLTSKGPVFFRQERVGQFGSTFTCFKFRSMKVDNDHNIHKEYVKRLIVEGTEAGEGTDQQKLYKLTDDPRITPIGKFIRRTSLDELPQFFNVLRGEMSLVGPRPPIPYEFECYSIWQRRRLLAVKPGITGLWQVGGRSKVKFEDMVRLDLRYARTWSLWLDIKILLKTPRAAVTGI